MEPTSETELIPCRNPSAPLGPFDAKAAAIIGDFVYTSPNQSVIWCPAPTEGVFLRSDFRFGPHDPTLWPQPHIAEYSYLGAIPSLPMDPDDPLSLMWWNPTQGDFVVWSGGVMDGIGLLRQARYSRFEEMKKELDIRITTYHTKNPPHELLLLLARDMANVLTRLGSLKTTFDQMVFAVTEFQRCYLETVGLLDYLEIYRLRKYGFLPASTASTVANCVGVITDKPNVVQDFFNAGLPVWFCKPKRPGQYIVLDVVDHPFEPSSFVCVDKAGPQFPVVYDGPLDACEKHNAVHRFTRSWFTFKDPFPRELSSATQTSTSRTSTIQVSKRQPSQSGGRDKFAPLEGPLAPFSIPAWEAALKAVNRSVIVESPSSLFAFPDPGLFVIPKDETKAKFFETWMRTREAVITCVAHQGFPAMNAQNWRDFLITDLRQLSEVTEVGRSATSRRSATSHKSAKSRRSTTSRLYARNVLTEKMSLNSLVLRCTVGEPLVWQGRNYPPGSLPPENIFRQVLWELYELNFAHEFLSLDRRACESLDLTDDEKLYERQSLISKCFVSNALSYTTLPNTNCGLAAENIRDRLTYLQRMVHIMDAWKGAKPAVFGLADGAPQMITDQQARDLEDVATKYYCQQFYSYFGRAAQVPHRLFPIN